MSAALPDDVPRRNGELVFDAPWESRAFGLVAAYLESTGQSWEVFRARLEKQVPPMLDVIEHYRRAGVLRAVNGSGSRSTRTSSSASSAR